MAAQNVIDIRLVDATAQGAAYGQPPGQAAGTPTNLPPAGGAPGYPPGQTPGTPAPGSPAGKPPGSADPDKELQARIAKIAGGIASAFQLVIEAIRFASSEIRFAGQIAAARIRGDAPAAEEAEAARVRNRAKVGGTIAGGAAGAVAGFAVGGPVGAVIGGIVGGAIGRSAGDAIGEVMEEKIKKFNLINQALQERGRDLSRYDMRLAQRFAISEVNQLRRDVGEAAIVGGRLAEVEAARNQLDLVRQQINIIEKMKEAQDQLVEINKATAERQEELNGLMKGLPEEMKRKLKELGEGVKDPFQQLEERAGFAGDAARMAANERGLMGQAQRARLNFPLLFNLQ